MDKRPARDVAAAAAPQPADPFVATLVDTFAAAHYMRGVLDDAGRDALGEHAYRLLLMVKREVRILCGIADGPVDRDLLVAGFYAASSASPSPTSRPTPTTRSHNEEMNRPMPSPLSVLTVDDLRGLQHDLLVEAEGFAAAMVSFLADIDHAAGDNPMRRYAAGEIRGLFARLVAEDRADVGDVVAWLDTEVAALDSGTGATPVPAELAGALHADPHEVPGA